MTPVRVLVVDDSPTMRRLIAAMLGRDPRVAVVGQAASAAEARALIAAVRPDVLTLDVEMPGVSGLQFLQQLMQVRPMPVVMVSNVTAAGSEAAVRALSLGAVDCYPKPAGAFGCDLFDGLAGKLLVAAAANISARAQSPMEAPAPAPAPSPGPATAGSGRMVLIGASTGGVNAIEQVLRHFPAACPPTVIVQHMPEAFLASFAVRLNMLAAPQVCLAREGLAMQAGRVVLAPGGAHHLHLVPGGAAGTCHLAALPRRNGHRPSVDETFASALFLAPRAVALLLTGMGADGAEGMARLRGAGARTLAQDEASAVVWGMPGAAWERGAVEQLVPLDRLGRAVLEVAACGTRAPAS